jgi:hypoxanthine phosphoribosyltransferase
VGITKDIEISIEGKEVLVIEDIVDSGRTVQFLKDRLALSRPNSVKVCTFLNKQARKRSPAGCGLRGKKIGNVFVVGYGIDFNEAYRNLPEICYVTFEEPVKM